jgi:hypothetical protein
LSTQRRDGDSLARRFAGPLPYTFSYEPETGTMVVVKAARLLPLSQPEELLSGTKMAKSILIGYLAFWVTRWCFQFVVFSTKHWRGNGWRTMAHLALSTLWTWIVGVLIWGLAGS